MHDSRNSSGSQPVFHSGCSRGPAISISAPSDDWCIVGSRMPSAMIQSSAFSTIGRVRAAKRLQRRRCRSARPSRETPATARSRARTCRLMMQSATSSRTEFEVPVPEEERHAPDVPPPADVEADADAGQRVAERAGQDGRTHERVVLALVQDVDEQRHRVAAARQRRAGDDVEGDPQPPRVAVVHRGDLAEPDGEAVEDQDRADARRAPRARGTAS